MSHSVFDTALFPTHNRKKTQSVAKDILRRKHLHKIIKDENITCLTTLIRRGMVSDMVTLEGVAYDDPEVYRLAVRPTIDAIRNSND